MNLGLLKNIINLIISLIKTDINTSSVRFFSHGVAVKL